MNTEQMQRAANTFYDAADKMRRAADSFEDSIHRLNHLIGDGYGNNIEKLIGQLEIFNANTPDISGDNLPHQSTGDAKPIDGII